eukprot:Lankesteria_metandrocarpae@DN3962_c0_g1_i2.p1
MQIEHLQPKCDLQTTSENASPHTTSTTSASANIEHPLQTPPASESLLPTTAHSLDAMSVPVTTVSVPVTAVSVPVATCSDTNLESVVHSDEDRRKIGSWSTPLSEEEFNRMQKLLLETRATNYALEDRLVRILAEKNSSPLMPPMHQAGKLLSRWGRQVGVLRGGQQPEDDCNNVLSREVDTLRFQLALQHENNNQLREEKAYLLRHADNIRQKADESSRTAYAKTEINEKRVGVLVEQINTLRASTSETSTFLTEFTKVQEGSSIVLNSNAEKHHCQRSADVLWQQFVSLLSTKLSDAYRIQAVADDCGIDSNQRISSPLTQRSTAVSHTHPLPVPLESVPVISTSPTTVAGRAPHEATRSSWRVRARRHNSCPSRPSEDKCVGGDASKARVRRCYSEYHGGSTRTDGPVSTNGTTEISRPESSQRVQVIRDIIRRLVDTISIHPSFGSFTENLSKSESLVDSEIDSSTKAVHTGNSRITGTPPFFMAGVPVGFAGGTVAATDWLKLRILFDEAAFVNFVLKDAVPPESSSPPYKRGGFTPEEVDREIAAAIEAAAESVSAREKQIHHHEMNQLQEAHNNIVNAQLKEIDGLKEAVSRQTRQLTQLSVQVTDYKAELDEASGPQLLHQIENLNNRLREAESQLDQSNAAAEQSYEMKCVLQDLHIQLKDARSVLRERESDLLHERLRVEALNNSIGLIVEDLDVPAERELVPMRCNACRDRHLMYCPNGSNGTSSESPNANPIIGPVPPRIAGNANSLVQSCGTTRCASSTCGQSNDCTVVVHDQINTEAVDDTHKVGTEAVMHILTTVALDTPQARPIANVDCVVVDRRFEAVSSDAVAYDTGMAFTAVAVGTASNVAEGADSCIASTPGEELIDEDFFTDEAEELRARLSALAARERVQDRKHQRSLRDVKDLWRTEHDARMQAEAECQRLLAERLEQQTQLANGQPLDFTHVKKPQRNVAQNEDDCGAETHSADLHETVEAKDLIIHHLLRKYALSADVAFRAPPSSSNTSGSKIFGNLFSGGSQHSSTSKLSSEQMSRVMEETLIESARVKTDLLTLGEEYRVAFLKLQQLEKERC